MAKKEKITVETEEKEVEIVEPDTEVKEVEKTEVAESAEKTDKKSKNKEVKADKKVKKAKDKKEKKGGLGKKIKESISEVKKVNWPTFGKVCKQTGMVISVVVICTLVLFGMDRLLSLLFTWLAY